MKVLKTASYTFGNLLTRGSILQIFVFYDKFNLHTEGKYFT